MDPLERRLSLTGVVTPDMDPPKNRKDVDSGWAWVVLAATFTSFFTSCGLSYNIGIFFVSFLDTFNESKSYTAWIGAVFSAIFQISGPVSSLLLPYFGARGILIFGGVVLSLSYALLHAANSVLYIMIVYGLFGGVGCLFVISGSVASMVQYFDERLYLASGIMSSGGGMGIMVIGLLTELLIETYGWRGSLLLLSGISLHICACGALVFNNGRRPKTEGPEADAEKTGNDAKCVEMDAGKLKNGGGSPKPKSTNGGGSSDNERKVYLRDIRFWYIIFSIMAMNMGTSSVYVFFKDILIEKGFESSFKLFLTSIGIGSTLGRAVSGYMTNFIDPTLYYFIVGSVCALNVFALSVVHVQWLVILVAFLFGLCHGVMAVLQTLKIAHVFGYDQMPIIWGYAMGFGSVSVLVGPPLGGWIADRTGNYNGSIAFFAILFFISGLFALFIYIVQRMRSRPIKEAPRANGKSDVIAAENCENHM